VRPLDHLGALARPSGKAGRIPHDDADRLAAPENVAQDLGADQAGGRGDGNRRSSLVKL
jgi:hypothetical protein